MNAVKVAVVMGVVFSGERREGRAPRRDDSTGRRRFGGDA
ncbi:Cold-shock DEAD-box protein A [Escherichia coli ISC41]|nr:Cold-shock DEAD-box protein A [Escherichia coli ISC41]